MSFSLTEDDGPYSSLSFQVLLLTILNTTETQVLGKGKRKDSECDRILVRLMVQYQWSIIVEHLSYLFYHYRF